MNALGAIVAGLVGTIVMSLVMAMAPIMGMPKMDIVGMLGSMLTKDGNTTLGWVMHLMMGIVFALIYAGSWGLHIGAATLAFGLLFGVVQWLIVGLMMGGVPMLHAGIKAGSVQTPGVYMISAGGTLAFMGGLIGHAIYGLVVALVYGFFIH